MEREPEFWEDYLQDEPFCRRIKRYWLLIAWELRIKQVMFPNAKLFVGKDFNWMNPYPNRKVKDPTTGKSVKMYENTWEAMPWSLVDDLYKPEVDRIVRKLKEGETIETLIKKYRWFGVPVIHNIVKDLGVALGENTARGGADIGPLRQRGVPVIAPALDATTYFDVHHTVNDTLEQVNPEHLKQSTAVFAVATYLAAMAEGPIERLPMDPKAR